MEKITDKDVWKALEAFENEIESWRVVRDQSSEYNDKGVLRYKHSFVMNDISPLPLHPSDQSVMQETFERHRLKTDEAVSYVRWRGLKAALEAVAAKE